MTGIPVAPGELVDVGYLNEVARAHYRKTTTKQVVNTIAETDLLNGEVTIGAGVMGTSRTLRLTAWGDAVNNSGSTQVFPRLKLKLGATTLLDTGTLSGSWGGAAGRFSWRALAEVANLGAANSQWAWLSAQMRGALVNANTGAAFTTGEGNYGGLATVNWVDLTGGNSGAVDTTIAQALALTVILPAAGATLDMTLKGAFVEVV